MPNPANSSPSDVSADPGGGLPPTRVAADAPLSTTAPALSRRDAEALVARLYGLAGEARLLSSERDQNFHIHTADRGDFVLKISNASEPPEIVDFQTRALEHIAISDPELQVPRLVRMTDGSVSRSVPAVRSGASIIRMFTYLQGVQVFGAPRSGAQRRALGRCLARLDLALAGFSHPASQHDLLWNVARAERLAGLTSEIVGQDRQRLVGHFMTDFLARTRPRLDGLRAQVIHNDLNLYNVLVAPDQPGEVRGIIDFGDIVHAPLVGDVATAAAYQMAGESDPLAAAAEFIGAYHATLPLTPEEQEVLPELIATRHLITVLISEWRAARHPANRPYIMRHNPHAWEGLARLAEVPRHQARDRLLSPPTGS